MNDRPQRRNLVALRLTEPEAALLDLTADRLHLTRSDVIRAGIRAVIADPRLVYTAPPVLSSPEPPLPPPPPAAKRARRRKR